MIGSGCIVRYKYNYHTTTALSFLKGIDPNYVFFGGCLIRSRNCLDIASAWVNPQFFVGVRVAYFFSFMCCPVTCLYFLSSLLWSIRLYLQLFVGGLMSYLRYLSCVPYVVSFSGLSSFECSFSIRYCTSIIVY